MQSLYLLDKVLQTTSHRTVKHMAIAARGEQSGREPARRALRGRMLGRELNAHRHLIYKGFRSYTKHGYTPRTCPGSELVALTHSADVMIPALRAHVDNCLISGVAHIPKSLVKRNKMAFFCMCFLGLFAP